jgi:hypothetical protein
VGRFLGLFMADVLDDALTELVKLETETETSPSDRFAKLKQMEDEDYAKFMEASLPDDALKFPLPDDIKAEVVYRGPNFCRQARIPAETRHLGYATESDKIGFLDYDKGIDKASYDQSLKQGGRMELIQDYKDYFYVHHGEELKWLLVPNDKEAEVYKVSDHTPIGYVLLCLSTCDWGNCPAGNLLGSDILEGKAEIAINDIPVTGMTDISTNCYWAKNANGHVFSANDAGRFNVSARVVEDNSYVRFLAIAVW